MASHQAGGEREKLVSKLPASLRKALKVRAAQLSIDLQDAVSEGICAWRASSQALPPIDTAGAESFGTWLPEGLYDDFRRVCIARGVSYIQGLAQSVTLWMEQNPAEKEAAPTRRIIVCNQKGGVGKTAVTAGLAQAFAEASSDLASRPGRSSIAAPTSAPGLRVLMVDYDPQGHLSHQLGLKTIGAGSESLITHMISRERAQSSLIDLTVVMTEARFGDRLRTLPAAFDAFLLDSGLTVFRGPRHAALERALLPLEEHFDVIVVDSPPSLGLAMDAAIYYGRRREGEEPGSSGLVIPVEAEDASAQAYGMLINQVDCLAADFEISVDQLGLVVNKYDSRRGYIATSSLEKWKSFGIPPVLAVIGDLKEQREAVRLQRPLLAYAPDSCQAYHMRQIARRLS
ncbi:ParA family protein [Streptomyces sp. 1222.5]|uniref:ParA family protein n=1 Tax=Streptomyces sp. 1222.5 TaxID=1881026 RepID=UPI003D725AE3